MVVSQTDWVPFDLRLNLWGRISFFLFTTIVVIIAIVSVQEYISLYSGLGEHFSNLGLVPTQDANTYFPLTFIIPAEYLRPTLTQDQVSTATIHHRNSMTTRNRFLQAIMKTNANLPLLQANSEMAALEDVERRESSTTICSAASLARYRRQHPNSRISVIDVVDNLVAQIVVPSSSKIFSVDDLKQKVISCGAPGSASNRLMQLLAKQRGWVQNRDFIVQEQRPDAVQLDHLFHSREPQIDAVLIVDTFPSPVLTRLIGDSANDWRFVPVNQQVTQSWDVQSFNSSELNQKGNSNKVNSVMTPMVMVANSTYPAKEILRFSSICKNPFMFYNLEQVVDMYKLPIHPTSSHIYQSLGLLGTL